MMLASCDCAQMKGLEKLFSMARNFFGLYFGIVFKIRYQNCGFLKNSRSSFDSKQGLRKSIRLHRKYKNLKNKNMASF